MSHKFLGANARALNLRCLVVMQKFFLLCPLPDEICLQISSLVPDCSNATRHCCRKFDLFCRLKKGSEVGGPRSIFPRVRNVGCFLWSVVGVPYIVIPRNDPSIHHHQLLLLRRPWNGRTKSLLSGLLRQHLSIDGGV